MDVDSTLDLLDWRRRVFALYDTIRAQESPLAGWSIWRKERDDLFATHPQSPLPEDARSSFHGLDLFAYDPAFRVLAELEDAEERDYDIPTSGEMQMRFTRVGIARFEINGRPSHLELYWLTDYGGGLFVPFRDETSGSQTYGAGRYLLDTVKGADLGVSDGRLVLDFNFAYNPSCAYDPRWVCPLATPPNRLDIAIAAGERTPLGTGLAQ